MGKYVKIALVLLYLLQLCIVFREQLEHIYEYALEARHNHRERQLTHGRNPRSVLEKVVLIARPAAILLIGHEADRTILSAQHGSEDGQENHLHEDDRKDGIRKFKRSIPRSFLIRNLYLAIRAFLPAPGALAGRTSPILREITFQRQGAA
jgi:hypothetical protein